MLLNVMSTQDELSDCASIGGVDGLDLLHPLIIVLNQIWM